MTGRGSLGGDTGRLLYMPCHGTTPPLTDAFTLFHRPPPQLSRLFKGYLFPIDIVAVFIVRFSPFVPISRTPFVGFHHVEPCIDRQGYDMPMPKPLNWRTVRLRGMGRRRYKRPPLVRLFEKGLPRDASQLLRVPKCDRFAVPPRTWAIIQSLVIGAG